MRKRSFSSLRMTKNSILQQALFLIFFIAILMANFGYAEETVYSLCPIVFVHGVNTSMMETWGYAKNQLEKYFKGENGYKYFHDDRQDYFPDCDYGFMNNGDIRSIAWVLKASIDKAIKDLPAAQQKVIIVAHSMGGLVVRSLLKQLPSYQSKIDRVVFVGTPHLGAPIASVLWIYNKISEEDLSALLDDNIIFSSQITLTPFRFQQISPSATNFDNRKMAILAEEEKIAKILAGPKIKGPYPDGIALEELRLAGDVSCSYYIDSYGIEPIPIIRFINENNTFLGKTPSFLADPSNFKVVRGINTQGNISSWAIDKVIGKYEKDFTFPPGQSLADAKDTGDGIVTQASQEGIGAANYTINAFHTDEPSAWQAILQALDDPPVIENVRLVRENKYANMYWISSYYIVVKVKDYLLADIEISDMNIGNRTKQNFPEFYDSQTKTYKPYTKFGKDFLKERLDTKAPIFMSPGVVKEYLHLYPGEFYVKVLIQEERHDQPIVPYGYIKLKNVAQKETECQIIRPDDAFIYRDGCGDNNFSYVQARSQAYGNFLASKKMWVSLYDNRLGFISYAESGNQHFFNGETNTYEDYWWACTRAYSPYYIKFNLDAGNKTIKSAKLAGTFIKFLKNGGTDFNLLVYRDTSNTWPPTTESAGDTLLFSFDTSSYNFWDDFEFDIDSATLNSNGANVWQSNPDFTDYNWIPGYVNYNSSVKYERSAYIMDPRLILIFEQEENNPP